MSVIIDKLYNTKIESDNYNLGKSVSYCQIKITLIDFNKEKVPYTNVTVNSEGNKFKTSTSSSVAYNENSITGDTDDNGEFICYFYPQNHGLNKIECNGETLLINVYGRKSTNVGDGHLTLYYNKDLIQFKLTDNIAKNLGAVTTPYKLGYSIPSELRPLGHVNVPFKTTEDMGNVTLTETGDIYVRFYVTQNNTLVGTGGCYARH